MLTRNAAPWLALVSGAALLLVAVWFTVGNAARAAPNSVRIEPAAATVGVGGNVNVSVIAEAPAAGFDGWIIDVTYNGTIIDATACQPYPPPEGSCLVDFVAPNTVRAAGQVQETSITGTVSLADITFQAVGSDGQCSDLFVNVISFADSEDVQLNPTVSNGQIVVGTSCGSSTPTPAPSATPTPNPDADGDGWTEDQEIQIGTNPNYPCGEDGWPAELAGLDNKLNIGDFTSFLFPSRLDGSFAKFGHPVPDVDDPLIARWNLDPNGVISIGDLNALNPGVNSPSSRPPMFGGQPAFFTNGGQCPYPP